MQMVAEGSFRQDLLYRINTVEIHIPPLRERGDDVLLLADFFLNKFAKKYNKQIRGIGRDAKLMLKKYDWPGNVRELQHAVERAVIMADSTVLKPYNFMLQEIAQPQMPADTGGMTMNLEELERDAIERAMRRADGNISRAAELLGITRFALYRKLNK
jgi:transcriptional regulator with PAS, ATPase and Fis domain